MTWNWQRPDWPDFSWNKTRFLKAEALFLVESGEFAGMFKHLGREDHDLVTVEAMSTEAVTTSKIEGELLNRDSVQSSIRRQLGLSTDRRKVNPAEQGIAEVMIDLHRSFAEPLSADTLFKWHRLLMSGRTDVDRPGCYRAHAEPMQVVSGPIHAPKIHFEAPPSADVPSEMLRFVDWFQRTAPGGSEPLPSLTRASIAHIYFVSIHPFEDGNGRIGRAIAEKALAQTIGRPTLMALAATILTRRKDYYDALEANNKFNEITEWVAWFAATAIEAQRRAIASVEFLIDKTRLLDRVNPVVNERQRKALLRMLQEGPEGFKGGLTAGKYTSITGASPATATRDLADLVAKNALVRTGERRHAHYSVAIPLHPVAPVLLGSQGNVVSAK
jgi:Fic family protein